MTDSTVDAPVLSDSTGADTGAVDSSITTTDTSNQPTSFIDPETIYSKLPDEWRHTKLLDDVLSDYNSRHEAALSEVQNKYSALEPFVGQDPEVLAMAVQVFELINHPDTARQVYDQLGKAYGYTQEQQITQQPQEQQPQQIPDEDLTDEQREIKALKEQIASLSGKQEQQDQIYQQQLHVERTKLYGDEIDTALKKVYDADPGLVNDDIRRNQLLSMVRAMDFEDRAAGKQPRPFSHLVHEAHEQMKAYNQHLYGILGQQGQTGPRNNAPMVMSPTGSTPAPQNNYAEMSENQLRDAAVAKLLEAASQ